MTGNDPSVRVELDTKTFNSEIKAMTEGLRTVQKEFKATDAELQTNGTKLDQLKNKYSSLEKQVSSQSSITAKYRDAVKQMAASQEIAQQRLEEANKAFADGQKIYAEDSKELAKLKKEVENSERALNNSTTTYERYKGKLSDSIAVEQKMVRALKDTGDQLQKQQGYIARVSAQFGVMQEKTAGLRKGITSTGKVMTASVTAPIVAGAALVVKAMDEVDEGLDVVMQKTGATGQTAKELDGVFRAVASIMPGEFKDIGAAVGELNTRLDFTGETLRLASEDFLKFAKVNGIDVNTGVQLVTRAMGDAGIASNDYKALLEDLTVASQKSGISIESLTTNLAKYGAPLRALGIDTKRAIALFATWEKAGVNTEIAFSGMKKAISTWGKQGKDSAVEFDKAMESIKNAPTIAEATTKAIAVFGAKAGPDLADAIKGGRFEVDKLTEALKQSSGAVDGTYGMIVDDVDDTQIAMQNLKLAVHDVGETIAKTAGPVLLDLANGVKGVFERFGELDESQQKTILKLISIVAAAGPVLSIASKGITVINGVTAAVKGLAAGAGGLGAAAGALSGPVGWTLLALGGLAAGAYALATANERATKQFAEMGDAVKKAGDKYETAAKQAKTVEGLSGEWKALNGQIKDGKGTAEELAAAEQRRKEIEQWFIDNYGDFIDAEQQKNGVRQETIGLVEEHVEALTKEQQKEAEIKLAEMRSYIPEKKARAEQLKEENSELEKTKAHYQDLYLKLKNLQNAYNEEYNVNMTQKEKNELLEEYAQKLQEITGIEGLNYSDVLGEMSEAKSELDKTTDSINKNKTELNSLDEAIGEYEETAKAIANTKLGGQYDNITQSLGELITAQNELNDAGNVTDETLQKIIDDVPGFADAADKPAVLRQAIEYLSDKLKDAGVNVDDLIKKLGNIPGKTKAEIIVGINYDYQDIGKNLVPNSMQFNATGTDNAHEGLSVVNEQGPELIESKNGRFRMAEGSPALTWLERGDTVYTARETRKMLGGRRIPGFADGKTPFQAAKEGFDYRKRTSDMSLFAQLTWWKDVLKEYADDAEAVKEANIEIYNLTKQLSNQQKSDYKDKVSEYMREDERWNDAQLARAHISQEDYLFAIGNRADKYREFADEVMTLDYLSEEERLKLRKEYLEKAEDLDLDYLETYKKIAKEKLDTANELSQAYLDDRAYFNDWESVGDDPIEAYNRVKQRNLDALQAGDMTQEEYDRVMGQVGKDMYDARRSDSAKWLQQQRKYNNISSDDYIAGLERQKKYTQEYYDNGLITYRQYVEDMQDLDDQIFDERKAVLDEQVNLYYEAQKEQLDARRKAINDEYAMEEAADRKQDRADEIADLEKQRKLFEGAATKEGRDRLESINEQIETLKKEEEKERREEEKQSKLDAIDDEEQELDKQHEAMLNSTSKYAAELTGIYGQANQDMADKFNVLLSTQAEQQKKILEEGYTSVCSLVDDINAKFAELNTATASIAGTYVQANPAPTTNYNLYQHNYNRISDGTDAEIYGNASGRAFRNTSFRG